MKTIYFRIFVAALSLVLLCGCAADNHTDRESTSQNQQSGTTDSGTQNDETGTVPDESGDASGEETEATPVASLTSEELAEWTAYFNTSENNGLLRFPYADPKDDPDQLAPYLELLLYDIGESGSAISEEEFSMLEQEGVIPETDTFRLTRSFINSYLFEKLDIPAEKTENLIDAAKLGTYLMWYDAWYHVHGDCAYAPCEIESGEVYEDGTIRLYYTNDFLGVMQDNGEMDYIDTAMVITLAAREDGSWYVVAHEINGRNWDAQ